MNLEELIKSGLVKDNHIIKVILPPLIGDVGFIQKGHWYQDHILDLQDKKLWSAKFYENTQTWVVSIYDERDDAGVHEDKSVMP